MATLQKKDINTQVNQNAQLFQLQVTTEQQSLNYMKRLTAVAISNILYLRNVFTEDCYGHRKLDHLKLRILTEKSQTVGAKQIVQWVKGCFHAMEKKYLKQLTLGIYTDPENPNELIEAYTFRISYDSNKYNLNISLNQNKNESVIANESMATELRTATIQLLRSLIIMTQSLDRLPNDCYLTMKLLYYDNTPEDYEPPGFVPSDKDSFSFKGKPISISAGEVDTGFHILKLKVRTNQEQFQDLAPSDSSDRIQVKELEDECTPLEIEDNNENIEVQPLAQKRENSGQNLFVPKVNSSGTSIQQKNKFESKQKSAESNVISKLKDMKMDDKYETNKRKHDFEVTQDSVFNSVPNAEKRFKASNVDKEVPLKSRY